jgi:hypothetical protein
VNSERLATSSRGRSLVGATLIAASLTITACGSDSPTILNTEKIERAIEHSSLAQRGTHAQVTCPSGVLQKTGLTFSCTALVRNDSTRFVVTQVDGSGRVHYEAR